MLIKRVAQATQGIYISCLAALFLAIFSTNLWAFTIFNQSPLLKSIQNRAPQDSTKEIQVRIQAGTLCQALSALEKKARSFFKCPESLSQLKVNPRIIRGSNWQSIVTQLLSNYNTIVLWDNDEIKSIYLLGTSSLGAVTGTQAARAPKKDNSFLMAISKLRTQWANAPLPKDLFNHPKFQNIFKIAQIHSPEDWKDRKKQQRAKQELRKLYEATQNEINESEE